MPTGEINNVVNVAGIQFGGTTKRTAPAQWSESLDPGEASGLAAGKAGTLSTRTDDNTGVVTLGADHGVTITDTVEVYWSGGMRYGVDVTVVVGNDVTLDLGAGDNLPSQDTAVVVGVRTELDADFDGDQIEIIAVQCNKRGHIEFQENDGTVIDSQELTANEPWTWISGQGVSNPLTGNPVGKIQVSCGEAAEATLMIGVLFDNVS